MKTKLFTKSSNAEVVITVKAALRELQRHRVIVDEVLDADTPDGAAQQELYGVMDYPAVVVVTDDGREVAQWQGRIPPTEELRYALGHI